MTPKETLQKWVELFNSSDATALADLYTEDAINYQVRIVRLKEKRQFMRCF